MCTCTGGPYDVQGLATLISGIPVFLLYFVKGTIDLLGLVHYASLDFAASEAQSSSASTYAISMDMLFIDCPPPHSHLRMQRCPPSKSCELIEPATIVGQLLQLSSCTENKAQGILQG